MRAQLAENHGDQAHMRADLERAADGFRALGDSWALGVTLSSLAGALMVADDLDEAETVLDEAAERLDALRESSGTAILWLRLADVRLRRGDFAAARELSLRAMEDADLRRDESVLIRAMLARIAWLAGDFDELRELVAEAADRLARLGPQRGDQGHAGAFVGALEALVAIEDGDLEAAATRLDAAIGDGGGDGRHADHRDGRDRRRAALAARRPARARGRAARRRGRPARRGGPLQPRGRAAAGRARRAGLRARPRAHPRRRARPASRHARRP